MSGKKKLPIVFKEQLVFSTADASPQPTLSLIDYKIDFDDFLGEGCFGKVYGVIKRPEEEKGFLSKWFPYFYDWMYRADAAEKQATEWCIKIPHSLTGSSDKNTQLKAQQLRQKYRITNLVYPC